MSLVFQRYPFHFQLLRIRRVEKRLAILFDTLFNVSERVFADAYTQEENYASLINFYTDISWLKNKNGKTIWKRRQRYIN